jgi:hypothetical protein
MILALIGIPYSLEEQCMLMTFSMEAGNRSRTPCSLGSPFTMLVVVQA